MYDKVTFSRCLEHMKKHSWNLDDVFPSGKTLDFSKLFLPLSVTPYHKDEKLLTKEQLLSLNQLTAKSYMNLFCFVEEFIVDKTNDISFEKENRVEKETFEKFSYEEIKHQMLFQRVMRAIDAGLSFKAKVLDEAKQVSKQILTLSDIAIVLLMLHLEIITQEHYAQSIRGDDMLDTDIVNVLKHHWIEESQHANLDYLELKGLVAMSTQAQRERGLNEYLACLKTLKSELAIQATYDRQNLEQLHNIFFEPQQKELIENKQLKTYTTLFVTQGLMHEQFNKVIAELFPNELSIFEEAKN